MTDQIDTTADEHVDEMIDEQEDGGAGRRRRMFLTGAGIAGAAAIVGSKSASAADGDPMILGVEGSGLSPTANETTSTTEIYNSGLATERDNNALKGSINDAGNNSHTILGTTVGGGHAIAGVIGSRDPGTGVISVPETTVAATWGRHYGTAAATEGQSLAEDVELAGPANGVKGIIESPTNGSHSVLGITNGAGHSVAGDTPGMIPDTSEGAEEDAMVANPNTTAATWGRHGGVGAGIGGVSAMGYGGEFVGGKAHVRLIQVDNADEATADEDKVVGPPTDEDHALGELFADGDGKLYFNNGTGAMFNQVTQQVLLDDPQRAWDSRPDQAPANPDKGKIAAGGTVSIDLTEFTDVPAGASGVLLNLSVADTAGTGFVTLFNGDTPDDDRPLAAAIAWTGPGIRTSNSVTVRPNSDGVIKCYVGEAACDVVIDVSGYNI